MALLPDVTEPAVAPQVRIHAPPRASYPAYRDCLRWDFGFTCAFCLLHEADLAESGAARTGLMTIEHGERRATRPDLVDAYSNCFLACRFCNQARSTRPRIDASGRTLLDPCSSAWATRFSVSEDRLVPTPGDRDAERTREAYDLDDPRKVEMRRRRRRDLAAAIRTVVEGPAEVDALLGLAASAPRPQRLRLEAAARRLQFHFGGAREILQRFRAVPADAPATCRCGDAVPRRLPAWLAARTRDLPVG